MGKRDELIAKYADDLRNKCGWDVDMEMLRKVTIACGPSIYNPDASTIAATQEHELETVKNNFLIKKLGLEDTPDLMVQLNDIIDTYGRSDPNKYRAVIYYMLAKRFQKDHIYA